MARILIVDNEPLVRFTLREVLEEDGHLVMEAQNRNAGIGHRETSLCDLAIIDLGMSLRLGLEMIADLKRNAPYLRIIATSGIVVTIRGIVQTEISDYLQMAQRAGADTVLAKPFGEEVLLEKVHACLVAQTWRKRTGATWGGWEKQGRSNSVSRCRPKMRRPPITRGGAWVFDCRRN